MTRAIRTEVDPHRASRSTTGVKIALALGWFALGSFVVVTAFVGGIGPRVRVYELAYITGFVGYLVLCAVCWRAKQPKSLGRWWLWMAGCVLLRLAVLHTTPSDDTYRYVWEGRVQLAGFNPYRYAPDAKLLTSMREADWTKINHRDYPAIYPALAQLEFRLAAWIEPGVYTLKVFHVVWDLVTLGLLAYALRLLGRPPHWAILYGLSPLVLSAFAVEGHLDSLMLALMTLAVVLAMRKHLLLAGAVTGLAISAKLIAAILLPWLIVRYWRGAVVAVVVAGITYLPFLDAGADVWSSLARFSSGDSFFSLIGTIFPEVYATTWGRLGGAALLALVSFRLAMLSNTMHHYSQRATGALLLFMPIVHYWYLSWVLVFLPLGCTSDEGCAQQKSWQSRTRRSRFVPPVSFLGGTLVCWLVMSLTFVVYFEGERIRLHAGTWSMPTWAPKVVWYSFIGSLLLEKLLTRRPSVDVHAANNQ